MTKLIEVQERKYTFRDKIKLKKYSLQFLPASLEDLSKISKFNYNGRSLKSAYTIDIVHNLLLRYYFRKENTFSLSSLILKEKYGDFYNYYMDYLVSRGTISLIKKHQKGKNSRIYKLNEDIINGEIKRYQNTDKVLLKKYRHAVSLVDDESYGKGILPDVKKKIVDDLFSVNIDFSKSIFYLEHLGDKSVDIYNKNRYSVECIKDNHIFYHFDDYGRFHTNFTILKSYIRKNCLLIDGEETFEKDITNSQPLFLCKLIHDNDIFIVDKNEFELFKLLVLNGNFYQYLIDNSGVKMERKEIKEVVYKVLFGRNYSNKHDNLFKKIFPTIYQFIKSYKKEKGDYRFLSYELQRAESNLIFNKIIKMIMNLCPEVKVITVHDSIICAKKYRDIVEIIFNKMLSEEFNF
jgi:hypothetical protein